MDLPVKVTQVCRDFTTCFIEALEIFYIPLNQLTPPDRAMGRNHMLNPGIPCPNF
jgi:hypothetical protein